ncbi:MAG TPA: CoA transferase [Candidatus Binatus sp.]|uniref:CaiB/BaiF CoA transferase family protein n=1 Tax=Candidatus Binatus sp. TaxID=2811406 RepID=UPI002B479D90|nr:CoA transferase [Candidatus Binatus sp.]HKN13629.1 CoA transferase [Candidatus Binatus sp.]
MGGPLEGIRIIDWTIWQQGPVATQMLADLGAEVIKIEERERGDPGRGITAVAGSATNKGGRNYYFEANNKHKKSIALNLKQPEAREIMHRLAARSDVFVQNFRKGVASRLGLGYADLAAHNPRLIYASASGYGPEGPDSGEPSFDYLGQARSGIMNAVGTGSTAPTYVYGGIADQMGAIMLAYGVLAALFARERTGIGQEVDASHLGSMMALQGLNVVARTIMGKEFPRNTRANAYNPLWNHYRCADDKWISLAMLQPDRYWKDFCEVIGKPELIEDPRFAEVKIRGKNSAAVVAIFDEVFATRPRDEWMRVLKGRGDFIYTIVNSVSDLPEDPQVRANDYVVDYDHPALGNLTLLGMPVKLSATPGEPRGHAPELGEHTELLLTEMLGYSWDDVARLRDANVI